MVEPLQNDFVQAPLQVRWKSKFPRAERFAVLLDRSPLARGKSVDSLEVQERGNLWITESEELLIAFVPQRRTKVASRRDRHRIIVVPLDAKGRRRGDDLASVELTVVSQ